MFKISLLFLGLALALTENLFAAQTCDRSYSAPQQVQYNIDHGVAFYLDLETPINPTYFIIPFDIDGVPNRHFDRMYAMLLRFMTEGHLEVCWNNDAEDNSKFAIDGKKYVPIKVIKITRPMVPRFEICSNSFLSPGNCVGVFGDQLRIHQRD